MDFNKYRDELADGKTVQFRPRGNSMIPKIYSGNLITVEPISKHNLQVKDIVFCKVNGTFYVHLITGISDKGYQISNNKNHVNGIIKLSQIFGKVTRVEQ